MLGYTRLGGSGRGSGLGTAAFVLTCVAAACGVALLFVCGFTLAKANYIGTKVDSIEAVTDLIYTAVTTIATKVTTILTTVNTIDATADDIDIKLTTYIGQQCQPLLAVDGTPILFSGCYFLIANTVCPLSSGTCLPVLAPQVTLDLNGFELAVGPTVTAIDISLANDFVLRNGRVRSTAPANATSSVALLGLYTNNVRIENVRFSEFFRTMRTQNAGNWRLSHVDVDGTPREASATKYWGYFPGCKGLDIEDSTFVDINSFPDFLGASFGLYFRGLSGVDARGLHVRRSTFRDSMIFLHNTAAANGGNHGENTVADLVFEGSTFEITDPNFYFALAFVLSSQDPTSPSQSLSDVVFRRNRFIITHDNQGSDCVGLGGVAGVLFEDNVFDCPQNGSLPDFGVVDTAAIHIGTAASYALFGEDFSWRNQNGITIRRNIFRGAGNVTIGGDGAETTYPTNARMNHAIVIEPYSSDITIDDNDIEGVGAGASVDGLPDQQPAGVLVMGGTSRITISNNRIRSGSCATADATIPADGIRVMDNFTRQSLVDSFVATYPAASDVVIEGNKVFYNCGTGIYNAGVHSRSVNNKLGRNTVADITEAGAAVVNVGDPTVAGANLIVMT